MATVAYPNGTHNMSLAEAPVSLNCFVETDLGKVQVTGRGHTGAEAAANLRDAVAALAPAPPEPHPSKSPEDRLGTMLVRSLAKAAQEGDCKRAERITKAAALVLSGAVQPGNRPRLMAVRSESNPLTWYEVEGATCTCPDYLKHGAGHYCKHVIAVVMYDRMHAN